MGEQLTMRFSTFVFLAALGATTPLTYAAQDTLVLIANSGDSTVSIFTATNVHGIPILRALKVLPTGKAPSEICLSPDGQRAYVSNGGESSITAMSN